MYKTLGMFVGLVFVLNFACMQTRQADDEAIRDQIRDAVRNVLQCRRVPGLTLAVVKDEQTWMVEGFGVKEVENKTRVNDDTKFCIGSLTKAFTATLMAKLIQETHEPDYEGSKVLWNTRLRKILGSGFYFEDKKFRSSETTIRDLLAHKMGFPSYRGAWHNGLNDKHSRKEYCWRLHQLQPVAEFRETFTYNNFMYILVGCLAEKITESEGLDIIELIQNRVIDPVGLNHSVFPPDGNDWSDNFALPHVWVEDEQRHKAIDTRLAENIHPAECAGGICSTPGDMAKWMNFLLQGGKVDGKQIVKKDILREIFIPTMSIPSEPIRKPAFPYDESNSTYGMAWQIGMYRGYLRYKHTGGISGYSSLMTLYPDVNIGIFTSVNGPMFKNASYANKVIHNYITDLLLELPIWLNSSTLCTFPSPWAKKKSKQSKDDNDKVNGGKMKQNFTHKSSSRPTDQANWYSPYVGVYGHLLLGNISVYYNETDSKLHFLTGRYGQGYLEISEWENTFYQNVYGPLWHVYNARPSKGTKPLMSFWYLVNDSFQKLEDHGYEPRKPPIFKRDLKWTDLPGKANFLKPVKGLTLSIMIILLNVVPW